MLTNYENNNGTPRNDSIWDKLSQIFEVSKSHVMGLTTDIETTKTQDSHKIVIDITKPVSISIENQTDIDILTKLDILDEDDTEEILQLINKLLNKDKYKGQIKQPIEFIERKSASCSD